MTIQISVTIWTVLCFLALMVILDRLLFRPILSFMDKRREKIDGARAAKADAIREREEEISRRAQERIDAERRMMQEASAAMDLQTEENARRLSEKKAENECRLAALDEELSTESERILSSLEPRTESIVTAFADRLNRKPEVGI